MGLRERKRGKQQIDGVRLFSSSSSSSSSFPSGTLKTRMHARNITQRNAFGPTSRNSQASLFIKFLTRGDGHGTCKYSFHRARSVIRGARSYDGCAKFKQPAAAEIAGEPTREKPCWSRGNVSSCRLPSLLDAIRQKNDRNPRT